MAGVILVDDTLVLRGPANPLRSAATNRTETAVCSITSGFIRGAWTDWSKRQRTAAPPSVFPDRDAEAGNGSADFLAYRDELETRIILYVRDGLDL